MAALEETVLRLCAHTGVPRPAASAVVASDEVRALVAEGKSIKEIKWLREDTGLGLRAAKLIVDELDRNG